MLKRIVSLLLVVVMTLALLPAALPASAASFKDVAKGQWYYDGITYVTEKNYFNGVDDGTRFDPDGNMQRGMVVTVLWRIAGKPAAKEKAAFSDVGDKAYYTEAVYWAAETGITTGTSATTFSPQTDVTRETFATLLRRFAVYLNKNASAGGNLGQFTDYRKISSYAWEALSWACNYGLVTGNAGKIMPQDKASRSQVAIMIMRFDEFLNRDIAPDYRATLNGSYLNYTYTCKTAGTAQGTVSMISGTAGKVDLYWGDGDKILPNATPLIAVNTAEKGARSVRIGHNVAIPAGVTQLLACDEKQQIVAIYDIPEERQFRRDEPLLTFAAMSDLHVDGSANIDGTTSQNFINALTESLAYDIQLVAVSGDIGADGRDTELQNFRTIADNFTKENPTVPIYTVTGNHDTPFLTRYNEESDLPVWAQLTGDSTYYTGSYSRANVDSYYDYTVDAGGSTFVFLNQQKWSYDVDGELAIADEQLDWLEARLKENRKHNVFLFFHSFLDETGGNVTDGENKYQLPFPIHRADGERLNSLLLQYPNAVFFNGHSHFEFDQDGQVDVDGKYINGNLNIYENDYGATYVHIPSIGYPRTLYDDEAVRAEKSQGYIVYVYEDCIILRGTEFKKEDTKNKLLSTHYYIVSTKGNLA